MATMVPDWLRCAKNGARAATLALALLAALIPAVAAAQPPQAAQAAQPTRPLPPPYPPLRLLLPKPDVSCIYQDRVGFIWMCTDEGIVRFDGREEVTFARGTRGLRAILRRSDGHYWVGGASGLYELQAKAVTGRDSDLVRTIGETPFSSVNGLTAFSGGSLGIATDNGAWELTNGQLEEIDLGLPPERAKRHVTVLFESQAGSVWAGTSHGLYLRRREGTRRLTTADGLPGDEIQALVRAANGRVWVGTRSGLAEIDVFALRDARPNVIRPFGHIAALRGADVRALRSEGADVLVGTAAGVLLLARRADGQWQVQRQESSPPVRAFSSNGSDALVVTERDVRFVPAMPGSGKTVITSIVVDGRPQAVPVDGLKHARIDLPWRTDLVEVRFVRPRKELWRYADPDWWRNPHESYFVRTGRLGDGTAGFSDVPPEWTRFVVVDDGRIAGGLFVPAGREYRRNSFLFSKPERNDVSPVVLRPSRDQGPPSDYASQDLLTADINGWLVMPEAAQRRAVIETPARTIGAGLHRLVIYGGSRFGGRGDSASVDLVVAEAPWVRWWFLAPAALVIAALFVGQRVQRKRRDAEISAVRSRIAADLHDSVGASLSRIAILSDVLTKQLQGQISGTAPSLNAIGDNARSAIDEMNDAVWFIDPKVRTVGQLLVRVRTVAAQLFDPDVTWTVDAAAPLLDIELDSDQRRNLYLLIKEALTNAHRHAQPCRVEVRLAMASTGLRVDIEDDGTPAGPSVEREGNGVANMRSRAAALGGSLSIETRAPGPGTGVVVQTSIR